MEKAQAFSIAALLILGVCRLFGDEMHLDSHMKYSIDIQPHRLSPEGVILFKKPSENSIK